MGGLQSRQCANHPERFGHALCMSCSRTICQECATVWDGINYCAACLAKRGRKTAERSTAGAWVLVSSAVLLLIWLVPKVLVWGAAIFASAFS